MGYLKKSVLAIGTFALMMPAVASAATISGTINENSNGIAEVDYHTFIAGVDGTYTFDVLSRDVLGGDAGDGYSDLDAYIYLFAYDAGGDQGMLGTLAGVNDDGNAAGSGDGSVNGFDSFLSLALTAGSYVLALGDFHFSEAEARSGINDTGFSGTYADYQITTNAVPATSAVPLPAGLPLLLAGLGGFGLLRRKKT